MKLQGMRAGTATDTTAAGGAGAGATMRAIVQDGYGPAEVLHPALVPRPTPAVNEVLLRVQAAGLDRGTWHLMSGRPYLMRLGLGLRRPRNPIAGRDIAGTVVAVGAGVTGFLPGDEVFGIGRGSFAEYAVARADKLARKPKNANFAQAAVVPVSAMTALQALCDAGRIAAGEKVLIIGASGGVGSYAVQLAKGFGAEVTAVCSTGKLDLVRSLGADHAIDYTATDFAEGPQRFDLILDIAGNPSLSRLRRALTAHGTAVIVGGEGTSNWSTGINRQLRALVLSPFVRQRLTMLMAKQRASDLEVLAGLIEAGTLTPCVGRSFPLEDAAEAMRYLEAGKVRGKVAITL
ncbi:MAG TPA: NAD(P)-dependent alcohol dehydrogenase [Micrococcaceae bacterium]|jgi:NADPH:quinone reductase-like Zn-dependent oxidoreductase|nr:NAD(P)-dependent alcohol dehydrogenase [Micrococcaceae bacterium]